MVAEGILVQCCKYFVITFVLFLFTDYPFDVTSIDFSPFLSSIFLVNVYIMFFIYKITNLYNLAIFQGAMHKLHRSD